MFKKVNNGFNPFVTFINSQNEHKNMVLKLKHFRVYTQYTHTSSLIQPSMIKCSTLKFHFNHRILCLSYIFNGFRFSSSRKLFHDCYINCTNVSTPLFFMYFEKMVITIEIYSFLILFDLLCRLSSSDTNTFFLSLLYFFFNLMYHGLN